MAWDADVCNISSQPTQHEFALLFGVHHMTVSKWEQGTLSPSGYQLALMTEFQQAVDNDPPIPGLLSAMLTGSSIAKVLYSLLGRAQRQPSRKAKR